MADVFVVVTVLAFFGLCAALVWGCDKIIGPDETGMLDVDIDAEVDDLAAEVVSR
jgi:hypothetical protein